MWWFEGLGARRTLQLKDILRCSDGQPHLQGFIYTGRCTHLCTHLPACWGVRHCWSWWSLPVLVFQWEPQLNTLFRYVSSCSYRSVITTATTFRAETSGNTWDCKPSQWLSAWKIQAGTSWFLHLFPLYLSLTSSSCYETQVTNDYHRCAPRCPTQQFACTKHTDASHIRTQLALQWWRFIYSTTVFWIFMYLFFVNYSSEPYLNITSLDI